MKTTRALSKKSSGKSPSKASVNYDVYRKMALVYDTMSADAHSLKMVPYTFRIFRRYRFSGRHGLDLCCGTGSAALAFADAGYTVRGVDGSPYMLRRARAKRRAAPVRIASRVVFGPGVMPDFRANSALKASAHTASLDFVTCYYDSLNYLLRENDLRATFRTVAELLKPGGLFVFDMNSNHALKVMWGKSTYAGAGENMAWIWKNRYLPRSRTAEVEAIFFKRNGKANTWRRFSEAHTERAYKISAVRRLLRESALAPLAAYRCFTFTAASEKNFRHCYVARRKDRN